MYLILHTFGALVNIHERPKHIGVINLYMLNTAFFINIILKLNEIIMHM